jgi:hypothetical protein
MIEKKIDEVIAALDRLTAAFSQVATAAAPAAVKPVVAKPAKSEAKLQAEANARVAETEKAAGPSKDEISKAVEELLKANKRKEAIDLMKKFDAKSVSTIKESDYAAFLEEANAILIAA